MARARLKFKRKNVKIKSKTSRGYRKIQMAIAGIFLVLLANFAWDGYNRQDDLQDIYKRGNQYYGIIVNETVDAFGRIKKQIDTQDNTRK